MARPIRANIPHTLGKEEARRRLQSGFANIQKQLTGSLFGMISLNERWEGDQLHFEGGAMGQKVTGHLDVQTDSILIEIDLPDLLAGLAQRITSTVTKETRKLLDLK